MGARDEAEREIAESVAALAMLRQQICGMYALLQERGRQEGELAERLEDAALRQALRRVGVPTPEPLFSGTLPSGQGFSVDQLAAGGRRRTRRGRLARFKAFDRTTAPGGRHPGCLHPAQCSL